MAITRNPLQEQLLKSGLAKKSKVDQAAREQAKQRLAPSAAAPANDAHAEAERARLEKVERDRALSAERNAQARAAEVRAQVRQIVERSQLRSEGDIAYRFQHDGAIRTVLVDDALRRQLANGTLVIVRHDAGYAIVPRAAAEKIDARDATLIALDHRRAPPSPASDDGDDEHYSRFKVPDDLIW